MKRTFFFIVIFLMAFSAWAQFSKLFIINYTIDGKNITDEFTGVDIKWGSKEVVKKDSYGDDHNETVYDLEIKLYNADKRTIEIIILTEGVYGGGTSIYFENGIFLRNPRNIFQCQYYEDPGRKGSDISFYEVNSEYRNAYAILRIGREYLLDIESTEVLQLLDEAGVVNLDYNFYTSPWKPLLFIKAPLSYFEKLLSLGKRVEPEFVHGLVESPLVQAIQSNNYEVVDFLIKKGANVNREHQKKQTPLHFAAEAEDPRILRRLIEAGAIVNKSDEAGSTPLHRATRKKENIEILLAHGANINAVTARGQTPLMVAVNNPICSREIVQTLLARKPNIDTKDSSGQTALIIAAQKTNRAEIITLLLNAGANAKLEDNTGRTALDWFDRNQRISKSPVRKELKDRT